MLRSARGTVFFAWCVPSTLLTLFLASLLVGCSSGGSSGGGAHLTDASAALPSVPVGGGPPVWQGVNFPASWSLWPADPVAVPVSSTGTTYYVDASGGSDSNSGSSLDLALRTISAAATKVQAGDTVLIRKGLYKESPQFTASGTDTQPITFGSYGDGEVIVDGSPPLGGTPWVVQNGTVWTVTNPGFTPVCVVVNGTPLREVSHGQTSLVPAQSPLIPVSNSGQWYYDPAAKILYADFGTTLGSGNPSSADVIVPRNRKDPGMWTSTLFITGNYVIVAGLTVRGATYGGINTAASYTTIVDCKIEFNGGGGITLGAASDDEATVGDQILYNLVHDNVLENWPRGNNDYCWGGWPMHVGAFKCYQCLYEGNIVYHGGGEGILNYGSATGVATGSNTVKQNVIYDNWSTEIYFDNQAYDTAEENFTFSHPRPMSPDPGDLLGYWDKGARGLNAPGVSLSDEGQSGPGAANAYSTVTNNIIINSFNPINDGCDGASACATHALKYATITHNTIIMTPYAFNDSSQYGLHFGYNGGMNSGSTVNNNVVVSFGQSDDIMFDYDICPSTGICAFKAMQGIAANNNIYFRTTDATSATMGSSAAFLDGGEKYVDFPTWQSQSGQDADSSFADPGLFDILQFQGTATAAPVYDPKNASPTGSATAGAVWSW